MLIHRLSTYFKYFKKKILSYMNKIIVNIFIAHDIMG